MVGHEEQLARGERALVSGDWSTALHAFENARATSESARSLEGLARSYYGLRDYVSATDAFERAFVGYQQGGDIARAAYVAGRWLAFIHGAVYGNEVIAGGWIARAQRLAEDAGAVAERGWVELMLASFASDRDVRESAARAALATAEGTGDPELLFCARAYVGECLVLAGNTVEGLALIDEALSACSTGEVRDFVVVGEIYCKMFGACEHTRDVVRAEQWLSAVSDLGQQQNLTGFTAICRTHYGGILTSAGRWAEADAELGAAIRAFEGSYRALGADPVVRLADLRIRQGRLDEAAQLLTGLDRHPDAARPLAQLHAGRGELELAQDVVERALGTSGLADIVAGPLLALLVDVLLTRGAVDDAAGVAERLFDIAARVGGNYLLALSAMVRGRLCLARGSGDARACLEDALKRFADAQMPLEHAEARLELARAVAEDRREVAIAEAKAALDTFERLPAARHADAAVSLLRSLGAPVRTGPKGHRTLTKRETEILALLGHGLSNREIGERLFISTRTVEHHVGRVLMKLGLRRRAEATAYAARAGSPR